MTPHHPANVLATATGQLPFTGLALSVFLAIGLGLLSAGSGLWRISVGRKEGCR